MCRLLSWTCPHRRRNARPRSARARWSPCGCACGWHRGLHRASRRPPSRSAALQSRPQTRRIPLVKLAPTAAEYPSPEPDALRVARARRHAVISAWPGGHRSRRPRSPRLVLLISVPLLCPLPRQLLLPLPRPLVAVRPLAQLLKLSAGLGLANGLERLFERFPGPLGAGPRLASQDLVRHLGHSLLLFHGLLLPGGRSPVWRQWYYPSPPGFARGAQRAVMLLQAQVWRWWERRGRHGAYRRSTILLAGVLTHSLCRGLRPSFSTPELPRAGYLVRERVSVGMFSYRVADSEAFDEPRGENTACSPKLVEK